MNRLHRFEVDKNSYFEIVIPDFLNKDNYYYPPKKALHMFDIVTLLYCNNQKRWSLLEDNVEEIILVARWAPAKALKGERILPDHIPVGQASLFFTLDAQHETSNFEDHHFWLWSSPSKIQTWLYTRDDKIYLEVSYTYPWLFVNPEPSDNYYTFDEYVTTYKPIALHEMSKQTAEKWMKQSQDLLQSLERSSQKIL